MQTNNIILSVLIVIVLVLAVVIAVLVWLFRRRRLLLERRRGVIERERREAELLLKEREQGVDDLPKFRFSAAEDRGHYSICGYCVALQTSSISFYLLLSPSISKASGACES